MQPHALQHAGDTLEYGTNYPDSCFPQNGKVTQQESDEARTPDKFQRAKSPPFIKKLLRGLINCLRPIWVIVVGKAKFLKTSATKAGKEDASVWVISLEEISGLRWLGSGSQGAVFWGMYGREEVAVKKVAHKKDTDINHLKKLDHPNIIKFRWEKSTQTSINQVGRARVRSECMRLLCCSAVF